MIEKCYPFPEGEIRIRPMERSDLHSVVEIERSSFPHPWTHNQFLSELCRQSVSRCYVARVGRGRGSDRSGTQSGEERIVGYIMAWLVADECQITNLAVLPGSRRHGVAAALLRCSIDDAVQGGARWCQLEVRSSNTAAKQLYSRFGFKPVVRRKRYYQDGEDAVVMGRELESST